MANLYRSYDIVNANNDADTGAAAAQQKAVRTRQKMDGKRTKCIPVDMGKAQVMLLKQQSMRQSCQCYKLTHRRQREKDTRQGKCDSH